MDHRILCLGMAQELDFTRVKDVDNLTWAFLLALIMLALVFSSGVLATCTDWARFWTHIARLS